MFVGAFGYLEGVDGLQTEDEGENRPKDASAEADELVEVLPAVGGFEAFDVRLKPVVELEGEDEVEDDREVEEKSVFGEEAEAHGEWVYWDFGEPQKTHGS